MTGKKTGEKMVRQRIVFRGWVQGVGFRYRAIQAANMHGVTGWVKNNLDDSVTMEIQGSQEQIDQVVMTLAHARFIRIEHMDVTDLPVEDGERGFRPLL